MHCVRIGKCEANVLDFQSPFLSTIEALERRMGELIQRDHGFAQIFLGELFSSRFCR